MSTTESTAVFATDDGKDLQVAAAAQLASSVWWNGHQQLAPSAAAVNNHFGYDYPLSYDAGDNGGAFYCGVAWPMSTQAVADDPELYVSATPMSSTVDSYKYGPPCSQSAVDYAMLECYAAVADPCSQWTYADSSSGSACTAAYELCPGGGAVPPVSLDYCNSLPMMQYHDAPFNGFALSANHQFASGASHVRQQAFVDKTASTRVSCIHIG